MAYDPYQYWQYNQDKRKQAGQGAVGQIGLPAYSSLPGGSQATGGPGDNISKFVGFDRILSANAGAAKNMAQRVSDRVEGKATAARQSVQDLGNRFGQQAGAGTLKYNRGSLQNPTYQAPDSRQPLMGTPQRMSPAAYSQASMMSARPGADTSIAGSAPVASRDFAASVAQGNYRGPNSLVDLGGYDAAAKAVEDARSEANQLDSYAGLGELLAKEYGQDKGGYSQGAKDFDAALAGAAGGSRFRELKNRMGNFDRLLQDALKASQGVSDQARDASALAAGAAQQDLGEYDAAQAEVEAKEKERLGRQEKEQRRRDLSQRLKEIDAQLGSMIGVGYDPDLEAERDRVSRELAALG